MFSIWLCGFWPFYPYIRELPFATQPNATPITPLPLLPCVDPPGIEISFRVAFISPAGVKSCTARKRNKHKYVHNIFGTEITHTQHGVAPVLLGYTGPSSPTGCYYVDIGYRHRAVGPRPEDPPKSQAPSHPVSTGCRYFMHIKIPGNNVETYSIHIPNLDIHSVVLFSPPKPVL